MQYTFICPNCKNRETIEIPFSALSNVSLRCQKCDTPMRRDWKSSIFVSNDCKAENIEQTSWIKERFYNRPSGKTQVLY